MRNYDLYIPTKVVYGQGRHKEIGHYLKDFGKTVMMVYGGGSIKRSGVYDHIMESFKENGLNVVEMSGVRSNPLISMVNKGIQMVREHHVDVLLAVGGGSVIDTCKAIACGALYDGDVWDFFCGKKTIEKALPISVVLTIPGTGSEVSGNAVLTSDETKEKLSVISVHLRSKVSILDPTLCLTVPKRQISNGIYDMLSHTMERYFSPTKHADVIDGIAEGVMKAILKNGPIVYKDPSNVDAWGELMVASDFSHNSMTGFGKVGDWTNHNIEEVISGYYDIPHGAGLSVLTPQWMRYIYKKHLPMFVQFAVNVMGVRGDLKNMEETALRGIEALENFSRTLDLPLHLSDLNVGDEKFAEMANLAASYHENNKVGPLEPLAPENIVEIYKNSLQEHKILIYFKKY